MGAGTLVLRAIVSIILATTVIPGESHAGQLVEFDVPSKQPSPLRMLGYLARPMGAGPFPAVVILHGCSGFAEDVVAWADRVSHWGYAVLAVDSFGPRGVESACAGSFFNQPIDGYRALSFLADQPFVRAGRVAVMGFSLGEAPRWQSWSVA
jgi:dienelactone hydrolase